jgi:hypothetical protein
LPHLDVRNGDGIICGLSECGKEERQFSVVCILVHAASVSDRLPQPVHTHLYGQKHLPILTRSFSLLIC